MTSNFEIEKWHGTGNDFVIASQSATEKYTSDIKALSRAICRPHFRVGADGLILIGKSDSADFSMRMWNPDGSESGMCGNGLRCVLSHLKNHGLINGKSPVNIETGRGVLNVGFSSAPDWADPHDDWVKIDMGEP